LTRSPQWTDLHEISHRGSSRLRNHLFQILCRSVQGFWISEGSNFYAQKRLLLSAHLSHRNSLWLSVRLLHGWMSKMVQARIIKSWSSAAWNTLVSGTV